jgi:DNA-binding transcriptional ArsR family regulator
VTPIERAFFARVHRKADALQPELTAAILSAFRAVAAGLSEPDLARLIALGAVDHIIARVLTDAALGVSLRSVQRHLRRTLEQAVTFHAKDVPVPKSGTIGIMFDVLNPNVVTAIRALDTKVLTTLTDDIREVVRAHIENGLRDGANPKAIARGIREIVGLSPAQELAVRNYRAELEAGQIAAATDRQLHDARFKVTKDMSAEKIDRMVAVYRKNMTAFHAETIARTGVLDAFKRGQELAWRQAIDDGIVDGGRLKKTWVQVDRPTKRDSHIPMNGETVPFDSRYSNGQLIPGEGEYNCACLSRVFLARAA